MLRLSHPVCQFPHRPLSRAARDLPSDHWFRIRFSIAVGTLLNRKCWRPNEQATVCRCHRLRPTTRCREESPKYDCSMINIENTASELPLNCCIHSRLSKKSLSLPTWFCRCESWHPRKGRDSWRPPSHYKWTKPRPEPFSPTPSLKMERRSDPHSLLDKKKDTKSLEMKKIWMAYWSITFGIVSL